MKIFHEEKKKQNMKDVYLHLYSDKNHCKFFDARKTFLFVLNCISYVVLNLQGLQYWAKDLGFICGLSNNPMGRAPSYN